MNNFNVYHITPYCVNLLFPFWCHVIMFSFSDTYQWMYTYVMYICHRVHMIWRAAGSDFLNWRNDVPQLQSHLFKSLFFLHLSIVINKVNILSQLLAKQSLYTKISELFFETYPLQKGKPPPPSQMGRMGRQRSLGWIELNWTGKGRNISTVHDAITLSLYLAMHGEEHTHISFATTTRVTFSPFQFVFHVCRLAAEWVSTVI